MAAAAIEASMLAVVHCFRWLDWLRENAAQRLEDCTASRRDG